MDDGETGQYLFVLVRGVETAEIEEPSVAHIPTD
jgi:hypothetical protein